MDSKEAPKFFIKSGDDGFASRQKNIFDQLNSLDREINQNSLSKPMGIDSEDLSSGVNEISGTSLSVMRRKRRETRPFRGKESIFKRPETRPARLKTHNLPDYQRHPKNWVKYSLADVSKEDMSDKSNTATAMAFLQELAARKSQDCEEDIRDNSKITFKHKENVDTPPDAVVDTFNSNKGLFKSSKLIMPEYVVGRETKKTFKSAKKTATPKKKEIKLDHLDEDEDID